MQGAAGHVWTALERRISMELSGFAGDTWRGWWCDGVVANVERDGDGRAWVVGDVWLGQDGQTKMTLMMTVPAGVAAEDQIDWDALLPDEELTGWLRIDERRREVHIDTAQGQLISNVATRDRNQ